MSKTSKDDPTPPKVRRLTSKHGSECNVGIEAENKCVIQLT